MDPHERQIRIWRFCFRLVHPWLPRLFCLRSEEISVPGPCLIVSNHVTNWDPLLLGMSSGKTPIYFVASEHLFRGGLAAKLVIRLMQPIARRKGGVASDTVKACLRHLKAGHTVCVFGEGDASWDGRTAEVFSATGKLAKVSGASLVTYRLEGGYLTLPRWGHGIRRGRMRGHPVRIYSPEELRGMKPEAITDAINRDICEDAWQRQRETPILFRGRRLAEGMETGLFLCPGCGRIGSLHTKGDRVFCGCGFSLRYRETGFFEPPEPFESFADWEDWQQRELRERSFPAGEPFFFDDGVSLTQIRPDHSEIRCGTGRLVQEADCLRFGDRRFPLGRIDGLALVKTQRMLFRSGDEYYEFRGGGRVNFRKYLAVWKQFRETKE